MSEVWAIGRHIARIDEMLADETSAMMLPAVNAK